jgi:hypothetical protein
MLLNRRVLDGVAVGQTTRVFRRWRRPTVRAGGRLRTTVGELAIDSVEVVTPEQVTDADAHAAGYRSRAALLADLDRRTDGQVYRIGVRLAGPDPREALRQQAVLSAAQQAEVAAQLDRLDTASPHGPWTRQALRLIRQQPGTRAAELAARLGRDTATFKTDVRKLKNLGLTESLPVGDRLSPAATRS